MNKDWKNMLIFMGMLFVIVWLIIIFSEKYNEKEDSALNYDKTINLEDKEKFIEEPPILTVPTSEEPTPKVISNPPKTLEEVQSYIQPNEVNLESLYITKNLSSNKAVDELFSKFYMSYASDSALFGKEEYWQTPKDLIKNRAGDCEDWAITMVSMVEAYNSSIDCYLAGWDTHMNMVCNFNNKTFGMFDQDKIETFTSIDKNPNNEEIITQENKVSVRIWLGNYFENYGLSPNERKLSYLINSKEIITFEKREDFINWVVQKEK